MSPPGLGRFSNAGAFSVVEVFGLLVLIIAASELTSTVCVECATRSVRWTVCFCPRRGDNIVGLLRLESLRFSFDGIRARLELRKIEATRLVRLCRSFQPGLAADDGHRGSRNGRVTRVCDLPQDGAGGFSLCPCKRGQQQNGTRGEKSAAQPETQQALGARCHSVDPSRISVAKAQTVRSLTWKLGYTTNC